MNPWYIFVICFLLIAIFAAAFIGSLALLIVKTARKEPKKKAAVGLCTSAAALTLSLLFICAHPTYITYNDWAILGSKIQEVEGFYGEFDLGDYQEGERGRVGYFIYTDNGSVMPDHLDHYYYIEYDERGVVYNVFDSCQPGG